MYVLQKRDSDKSLWHTCSYKGKKCRYADIAKARIAFRKQEESSNGRKHPDRQYRIFDTTNNVEVD